jgi:hypothetical protein
MRMVYIGDEREQQEFAERAAKKFAGNEDLTTYTDEDIAPGCLFALRWGLGDDCVVVFKLDDFHVPTNYQELVKKFK